jgi:hypothetical protein
MQVFYVKKITFDRYLSFIEDADLKGFGRGQSGIELISLIVAVNSCKNLPKLSKRKAVI